MIICRCPACHANVHADVVAQDRAASELIDLVTRKNFYGCGGALIEYIALFRPAKSNLSNVRSLNLAKDVLSQFKPSLHLRHALMETTKNIKESRANGNYTALTNHSYLTKVFESSKALFPYNSANGDEKSQQVNNSDAQDAYFQQMQQFGRDVSTLPGGKEWLTKQGSNERG